MLREPVASCIPFTESTSIRRSRTKRNLLARSRRSRFGKPARIFPARVRCPSYLFYRERADYAAQLARYFEAFPREHVLVMTMEEFRS